MESVPGAVATGSQPDANNRVRQDTTRSLPLPVLTSLLTHCLGSEDRCKDECYLARYSWRDLTDTSGTFTFTSKAW